MRIAMVVAGAGSMYCGACARDSELARALLSNGHEVAVFPIYTPLRLEDGLGEVVRPLMIGGINAYLQEKLPQSANLPSPIRRVLDTPSLIAWATRFAVQTQAADLGRMTISFLEGTNGPHREGIRQLACSVAQFHPEIVVLANSLLAGLIEPLANASQAPVVVQVQGEDGFLDELPDPWHKQAILLLQEHVKDAARFMAPCSAHANEMATRLDQPIHRFSIVPPSARRQLRARTQLDHSLVRIGHLSSIRRAKGLDLLLGALTELDDLPIEVVIRGKVLEPRFYRDLCRQTDTVHVPVGFGGEIPPPQKADFLSSCDFIVLPTRLNESRGIAVLEALAAGTPVIAPSRGIFPELAEATGGVCLYESNDALGTTIRTCVDDRAEWRMRGITAAEQVTRHYAPSKSALAAEACFNLVRNPARKIAAAR